MAESENIFGTILEKWSLVRKAKSCSAIMALHITSALLIFSVKVKLSSDLVSVSKSLVDDVWLIEEEFKFSDANAESDADTDSDADADADTIDALDELLLLASTFSLCFF